MSSLAARRFTYDRINNTVDVTVTGSQGAMLYIGIGPAASPESKSAAAANSKQ
ncbi:MAG: hypothetical protein ABSG25_16075 [Bryobacteraceae bacterium]